MNVLFISITTVVAYLLGSIPTAVWYGLGFFGVDVRQHGSGNAGATNTFRVLGKRAGTIVMLVDVLKGYTAAIMANLLWYLDVITQNEIMTFEIVFGLVAVIGHLYPIFAGFKGGKGVASLLGMVLAIHPEMALLCIGIFLLVVIASQYVSLGSILAALAFPVLLLLRVFGEKESPLLIVFGFVVFLMVVLTHQKNIGRLMRGQENRTVLIRLRKKRGE
ncbi:MULTISPECIES: glycerol-3-phosphate 1-O-acyltransferase PlsY [Spirosoma]|uniref:Glycerol-3-phosphate acyltransferase n=1 Tax=Spirosoma liriopis TaxID=2937440 RepID=A0ABT0HJM0_9BACT|nr:MULTISPECIES: glycerol-3-phosphate 1-O-acyltransferase PlsY [Spirosoma]MCK8491858.1 glycerol-3-phosphate 1-O-acyltransferase PlsY [Spirosoma liriopis]UHG91179.1 glycerol-3-phosphate 1-O-acyltransferase PlsY [Spirosoma oryzicola]